jgi:hypothetical protein
MYLTTDVEGYLHSGIYVLPWFAARLIITFDEATARHYTTVEMPLQEALLLARREIYHPEE